MEWYPLKGDGHTLWGRPFFEDAELNEQLAVMHGALWRAEDGGRRLALPYAPDASFLLTELFCFARIEEIRGKCYAVYCVDACGRPIMPPLTGKC